MRITAVRSWHGEFMWSTQAVAFFSLKTMARKSSGDFCSAINCTNSRQKNKLSFFRFPKNEERYDHRPVLLL